MTTTRMSSLGEFIRHRRQQLGLKQRDLADALGVDQTTISNIERRGSTRGYLPDVEQVWALASALGCTTADLLRAAGYLPACDDPGAGQDNAQLVGGIIDALEQTTWPDELKEQVRRDVLFVAEIARREHLTHADRT